jgi:hypothetical protein
LRTKLSVSVLAQRKIESPRPRKHGLFLRAEEKMRLYGRTLATLRCPAGEVLVGIDLELGGTCHQQCDADGRPIKQIFGKCQRLSLVATRVTAAKSSP